MLIPQNMVLIRFDPSPSVAAYRPIPWLENCGICDHFTFFSGKSPAFMAKSSPNWPFPTELNEQKGPDLEAPLPAKSLE